MVTMPKEANSAAQRLSYKEGMESALYFKPIFILKLFTYVFQSNFDENIQDHLSQEV